MANYHPPKIITNNAAPAITADLSYEVNGKCGCQTIVLSNDGLDPSTVWNCAVPQDQPIIPGCSDESKVYKIVAIENTKFRGLVATNIAPDHISSLIFADSAFILKTGSEIMANFTFVDINSGTIMLYRDCEQS
tara:strand:- start:1012 stop:1413 length:402 start_codon:yes stop_codon:yes gene_type:complete